MKQIIKKVSAIATSALMVGLSIGTAAAANYPQPFVVGNSANVAIVYGTGSGVSSLDIVQAGNIQSNLQSYIGGSSSGSDVSVSGEIVSLDTNTDKIWLNTALNSVKSTLTESDLPTVLEDYSFSGDTTTQITFTLKPLSGKVTFDKHPTSDEDPSLGIKLGTSATDSPLYNASATMSAIDFTDADSEGEEIVLFGQTFTVSSETDATKLVLLKEAEKISLSSDSPTATVTVDGKDYTVELVSASDTSATISVTNSAGASATKEVNEAGSKRINGIDVAVTNADENNLKYSASIVVGSQKVTLQDGSTVLVGEDDDPVDGTMVYLVGGTTATREIAIAVFAPDSDADAILPGESFVDPVFGTFKVDFAGMSSNLDDANRETISIKNSGDDDMTIEFTDSEGNLKNFNFAHNESRALRLADSSNYTIAVREMANLSYGMSNGYRYVIVGNEDYGHLLRLEYVSNSTGTDYNDDEVRFKDVMTGETYSRSAGGVTFTSEGVGTLDVDGKRYTINFVGTGENAGVTLKYPTSDSANANTSVYFPTIETKNGGLIQLYEPQTIDLDDFDGKGTMLNKLQIPDGDGYTTITLTYAGGGGENEWTVGSDTLTTGGGATDSVNVTVGELKYSLTSLAGEGNKNSTLLYLIDPEGTAYLNEPAVVLFEGKDDNTEYHAVVVDLETAPEGTGNDGVGVEKVLFTQNRVGESYYASATRASDSDITEEIDWFGTHTTLDASDSDQKTVEISYPESQIYAQVYVGEIGSSISGGSSTTAGAQLGEILVKDSEVSQVSSKNLIVVGGSCINSVAANLLGSTCGSDFTSKTGVGSGQFLIQSFASPYSTGKIALVVAGYDAADTVNAATYLRTRTVDTTVGKKYKGSSATSAELVTTSA